MNIGLHWLPIARLGVLGESASPSLRIPDIHNSHAHPVDPVSLGAVSFFALITLAVSAAYISTTFSTSLSVDGFRAWPQSAADPFAALDLAVAIFTLLTLPAM